MLRSLLPISVAASSHSQSSAVLQARLLVFDDALRPLVDHPKVTLPTSPIGCFTNASGAMYVTVTIVFGPFCCDASRDYSLDSSSRQPSAHPGLHMLRAAELHHLPSTGRENVWRTEYMAPRCVPRREIICHREPSHAPFRGVAAMDHERALAPSARKYGSPVEQRGQN